MDLPATLPAALVMRGGALTAEPGATVDPHDPALEHLRPRKWTDPDGFEAAPGDVYRAGRRADALVLEARLGGQNHRLAVVGGEAVYRGPRVRAYWKVEGWILASVEPAGELAEGERVDLTPCAVLIALATAEKP